METSVSVIVPAYNASPHIEKCLSSISEQTIKNFEVILVDNCSTDDTAQRLEKYRFKILKPPEHTTAAGGRNYGAKSASGNIIVFVDADVVLNPDSIKDIADLVSEPGIAAVSALYSEEIPQSDFFSQLQNLILVYRYSKMPKSAGVICSFFCAINKDAFRAVGGYDEKMLYYEDIELGHRLSLNGYQCRLAHNIKVTHLKRYNYSNLLVDYFKKSVSLGSYIKGEGLLQKLKDNGWPFSLKLASMAAGCALPAIFLVRITPMPFFIFLCIYSLALVPILFYLNKIRNFYFAIRAYIVFFEIFLISLLGLAYGIIFGETRNG